MIISLQFAEYTVSLITFLLAHTFVATTTGAFRAWVLLQLGDNTAQEAGFLTLNPIPHLDPIGVILLSIDRIAWVRQTPLDPDKIKREALISWYVNKRTRYNRLSYIIRLIVAYLADVFMYLFIALVSLVTLIVMFGLEVTYIVPQMLIFSQECLNHLCLAHAFPDSPSYVLTIGFVLIVITYLGTLFALLYFIINWCKGIMYLIASSNNRVVTPSFEAYLTILMPFGIFMFLGGIMRAVVALMIVRSGLFIAYLLRLV